MIAVCYLNSEEISLEKSIEIALSNNKEIEAERYNLKSSEWSKVEAFSYFLPKFSFNTNIVRIDNETYQESQEMIKLPVFNANDIPTGDYIPFSPGSFSSGIYRTSYTNELLVQQPIFNGGKEILAYQMAALSEKRENLSFEDKKNNISYTVAALYLNYLKLQEMQRLTEKSIAASKGHLHDARKKYELGTVNKSDVLQWQVKLNNDRTNHFEIKKGIEEIMRNWYLLLGTQQELLPAPIAMQDYDSEIGRYANMQAEKIKTRTEEFLNKVKKQNPFLEKIALGKKLVRKKIQLAKGNFLPSVNLQFNYQIESDNKLNLSGNDNWNLAAVASIPLFNSGSNYARVKQAEYNFLKIKQQADYAKENILSSAENVFNQLSTKAKVVEDNKISLEYAEENYRVIKNLYNQEMVNNSELLDAETMLYSSKSNLITSFYKYLQKKYEIKKYIGYEEK